MHNFRKLNIWLNSVALVTEIYKLTNTFPSHERFGIVSQMQRSAVSCPTNIAEALAKSSNRDFGRFLEIAHGSLLELETELLVSFNLKYVNTESYEGLQSQIVELQNKDYRIKKKLD